MAPKLSSEEKVPTVEEMLAVWAKQSPGLRVFPAECMFIEDMRKAARGNMGVGYGWMQQVIEWEWRSTLSKNNMPLDGARGPVQHSKQLAEKDEEIAQLKAQITILEAKRT